MLEQVLTPRTCPQRITLHALIYDSFVANVEHHSSGPSVHQFLVEAFEPVGHALYETFGVGLGVDLVPHDAFRSFADDPPLADEEKEELKRIYKEADQERRIIFDMIMYDLSRAEPERPHFVFAFVGDEAIVPEGIDLYRWPMYMGTRPHAGSSHERYCVIGINTLRGLSATVQHELSHSLGAEHVLDHKSIMYETLIHGRGVVEWDPQSREVIRGQLSALGFS